MIEQTLDLWSVRADAKCVTTNGVVRKDGKLVMGAGIAKEAADRYPFMPRQIGDAVGRRGNHVYAFNMRWYNVFDFANDFYLVTFPTKEHWRSPSTLELIERSARELKKIADENYWRKVLLPRPGCGLGGLSWDDDVRHVIASILSDDRFVVVTK
jgi:hypothetical protein